MDDRHPAGREAAEHVGMLPDPEREWRAHLDKIIEHGGDAVGAMNVGPPDGGTYRPPIGVWFGIEDAAYHGHWDAVSSSRLTTIDDHSPARLRYEIDNWVERDTPALREGKAIHCAVLEPDVFSTRYSIDPEPSVAYLEKCDAEGKGYSGWRNTKEYKELRAHASAGGNELLGVDLWRRCDAIRTNVMGDKRLAQLIEKAAGMEASIVSDDPKTGCTVKTRPDILTPALGMIGELKSVRSAKPDRFMWDVWKLGYHRQAALYLDAALRETGGEIEHHVFIAVEKEPPYEVVGYVTSPHAIDLGREHYRLLLDRYHECEASGRWPGIGNDQLLALDLPARAYTEALEW